MRSGTHRAAGYVVLLVVCLVGILCMTASAGADTLELPAGLTVIEEYAFYGDTSITGVVLPEGLKEIGDYAFAGCTNLTEINLPDGVYLIGPNAFEGTGCRPLAKAGTTAAETAIAAKIPLEIDFLDPADETKWQIGMYFSVHDDEYCLDRVIVNAEATPVEEIIVPDGVESIGEQAFGGLSAVTGITLPDSLRGIGAYAFNGCEALENVGLPSDLVWIHEEAFEGTDCVPMAFAGTATAAKAIEMKIPLEIDFLDPADETKWQIGMYFSMHDNEYCLDRAIVNAEATPVTAMVLPDGIGGIAAYAFHQGNETLEARFTSFTIPASVTLIDNSAFDACTNVTLQVCSGSYAEEWAVAHSFPHQIIAD